MFRIACARITPADAVSHGEGVEESVWMMAMVSRAVSLDEVLALEKRQPMAGSRFGEMQLVSSIPNSLAEFQHISVLGHGSFAVVYRCLHIASNSWVAMKSIEIKGSSQQQVQQELACMHRARQLPGVPRIFGCILEKDRVNLVMEHVGGRTLQDIMDDSPQCIMSPLAIQRMLQ